MCAVVLSLVTGLYIHICICFKSVIPFNINPLFLLWLLFWFCFLIQQHQWHFHISTCKRRVWKFSHSKFCISSCFTWHTICFHLYIIHLHYHYELRLQTINEAPYDLIFLILLSFRFRFLPEYIFVSVPSFCQQRKRQSFAAVQNCRQRRVLFRVSVKVV